MGSSNEVQHLSFHVFSLSFKTRTFQEVSINSFLVVKGCPETTCWKVLEHSIHYRADQWAKIQLYRAPDFATHSVRNGTRRFERTNEPGSERFNRSVRRTSRDDRIRRPPTEAGGDSPLGGRVR